MAVTARYTDQIVILTTPERGAWVKAMAEQYGVSQAQVARDCIELGSELLAEAYRVGHGAPGALVLPTPAKSDKPARPARRARVSETGAAPAAQFLSPTTV